MAKKHAGGLIGTILVAGAALGIAKYLKDYAGAVYTDPDEISRVKSSAQRTKDAAKRTFVAIKDNKDIKDAAADLYEAAGDAAKDAGAAAVTAGTGALNAARDIKARYDSDPEGVKEEFINNINEIKQSLIDQSGEIAGGIKDKIFSGSDGTSDAEVDEGPGCIPYYMAKESDQFKDDESESQDPDNEPKGSVTISDEE